MRHEPRVAPQTQRFDVKVYYKRCLQLDYNHQGCTILIEQAWQQEQYQAILQWATHYLESAM